MTDFEIGFEEGCETAQFGGIYWPPDDSCFGADVDPEPFRRGYAAGYGEAEKLPSCVLCGTHYPPATGEVVGYQEIGPDGICGACKDSSTCVFCGTYYPPATGEVVGYQEIGPDGICVACVQEF